MNKRAVLRIAFLLSTIILAIAISKTFKIGYYQATRLELDKVFQTTFDKCRIIDLTEKKYSGWGTYQIFKVDCKEGYFPVLLENMSINSKELFENNPQISKNSNSYSFTLTSAKNLKSTLQFRTVASENDNIIFSIFLPLVLGLFLNGCFFSIMNLVWQFY